MIVLIKERKILDMTMGFMKAYSELLIFHLQMKRTLFCCFMMLIAMHFVKGCLLVGYIDAFTTCSLNNTVFLISITVNFYVVLSSIYYFFSENSYSLP